MNFEYRQSATTKKLASEHSSSCYRTHKHKSLAGKSAWKITNNLFDFQIHKCHILFSRLLSSLKKCYRLNKSRAKLFSSFSFFLFFWKQNGFSYAVTSKHFQGGPFILKQTFLNRQNLCFFSEKSHCAEITKNACPFRLKNSRGYDLFRFEKHVF